MHNITLRTVTDTDAQFLFSIMNVESILDALNEVPTKLSDWQYAIKEWNCDDDEEDYIICDNGMPIGWLGINGLSSADKVAYLKMAAILPHYHSKGIGRYAIGQVIEMLRQRDYAKIALYTDQDNCKAKACYRKCGFEIAETLTEEMSNGKIVDRCKMELTL
ncbi:MAG: GNAT family N-acetyltransferase [Oscillospiraceae bacterium]|nr:GNAT family N-acetyltransferase [Oscillospiraceae bacterium]